jgi:hypothetical protein
MLWPEPLLIIGLGLAIRQFLLGHVFDPIATLVVFILTYAMTRWQIGWGVLIPLPAIIYVLGAFILVHEYFLRKESKGSSSGPDEF